MRSTVEPLSRSGNPASYQVRGKRYFTKTTSTGHVERGLASWYGRQFHGRKTSSGKRLDMYAMTRAHKTLPLPTYVQVTNMENGRTAVGTEKEPGPVVAASGGLYLQVGAFGDPSNAERLRQRLVANLSEQVRVQRSATGEPALFKVRIGPLVL